jgi:predicted nucleotidyltransferase
MLYYSKEGYQMNIVNKELPIEFQNDIFVASDILQSAGCKEIYIFGSIARGDYHSNSDIDFAIKGLPENVFFKIGGKLLVNLEHNFDLVALDNQSDDFSSYIMDNEVFIRVK